MSLEVVAYETQAAAGRTRVELAPELASTSDTEIVTWRLRKL